jgi:hypothetical protein
MPFRATNFGFGSTIFLTIFQVKNMYSRSIYKAINPEHFLASEAGFRGAEGVQLSKRGQIARKEELLLHLLTVPSHREGEGKKQRPWDRTVVYPARAALSSRPRLARVDASIHRRRWTMGCPPPAPVVLFLPKLHTPRSDPQWWKRSAHELATTAPVVPPLASTKPPQRRARWRGPWASASHGRPTRAPAASAAASFPGSGGGPRPQLACPRDQGGAPPRARTHRTCTRPAPSGSVRGRVGASGLRRAGGGLSLANSAVRRSLMR